MLGHVVEHMATKEDIANLGGQLRGIERELKSIRRDLDDLREKVENVSGFQKEIDHALERIVIKGTVSNASRNLTGWRRIRNMRASSRRATAPWSERSRAR
jgi:hypothetical protein